MKSRLIILVMLIMSASSYSQEKTSENRSFVVRGWESVRNNVVDIYREGENDFYLTGFAYHDRNTYTKEKLKDLNEGAYGLGVGRSKINEKGNTEMLYAMAHLDSHKDVQVNAGYAWVKKFKILGSLKAGIGYSAFLVSRSDFAGRLPLPFALPLLTFDISRFSINTIIIPKLNDGINNGNVLFIFAKYTWGSRRK